MMISEILNPNPEILNDRDSTYCTYTATVHTVAAGKHIPVLVSLTIPKQVNINGWIPVLRDKVII